MRPTLVLVRHAMPVVDPAVPSTRWELGAEGRAAARALRSAISAPAHFVASDEPKAAQTVAEIAGVDDVPRDPGFGEVRRPYEWTDDYRERARAYVDGVEHDGWETHREVAARFDDAVRRHLASAAERDALLVVGTHGLAPTIWLASRLTLRPDPRTFWAGLRFPDLIMVDLENGTAETTRNPPPASTG